MSDPLFPVFCGLAAILVLLPLPWHWQAKNSGTLLYIAWTFVGNLIFMVNTIIWTGNINNPSPVWCDISAKIVIGLSVALPACGLCINRRLYSIATIKTVVISREQKRREIIIDLFIGLGVPLIVMALHYIVQGHRYDILEDVGCWPTTYNSAPAYPLYLMWPIILALASCVYCVLSLRAFLGRRAQFNAFLTSNNSGLNISRYFRLMALASADMLFSLALNIFITAVNVTSNPIRPWISWEDTHSNFSRVARFPLSIYSRNRIMFVSLKLGRWFMPVCGILFFIFFGLAGEARGYYRRAFYACLKPFGINPPAPSTSQGASWMSRFGAGRSQNATSVAVVSLPTHSHGDVMELPSGTPATTERKLSSDLTSEKLGDGGSESSSIRPSSPRTPSQGVHLTVHRDIV